MELDDYMFVLAVLIVHVNISMSLSRCGPELKCSCVTSPSGTIAMDCKARKVNIRQVCESIAQIYPNVSDLNIARNNIGNFNAEDVNNCRNISSLNMNYNQISSLHSGVFKDFQNILALDLSDNVLDIFNKTAFDPGFFPSTLRILKLFGNFPEDNEIERSFDYPNLTYLQKLEVLEMDGIETDIGLEYENSSVRNLTLSSKGPLGFCSIKEIFPTTFYSLVNVRVLDISSCKIENIYRDAFKNLVSLEILDLSLNRRLGFSSLMNVSYSLQFTNIQFLNYSRVYTTFGVGTIILNRDICYLRNTSLKAIAFDGNKVQMVEKNTFVLFPKHLETIYAQENKFSFGLYLFQFGCLENVLQIDANNQNKMHAPIKYLAEPKSKDDNDRSRDSKCQYMTEESLKTIAKEIPDCTYVPPNETAGDLKPQFSRSLKRVYFSGCNMVYNLDKTEFTINPSNNSLEVLDSSKNAYPSLRGRIGPFPNLKFLSFSRSYCSFISSDFLSMYKLENLQLDRNYLGGMFAHPGGGDTFKYLTNLKMLNLSTNRITHLKRSIFSRLGKIEEIDLSGNSIEQIDIDVQPLKNLLHLNFRDHDLHFIRADIIPRLEGRGMKLCVHQRDFLPGIPIQDNIVDAIRTSKKTVVILSKAFIKKQWCIFEFNMARMESIGNRECVNGCLVIVLYENVPTKELPLEIMDWMDNHSYISYTRNPDGQLLFWENLTTAIER
ncbi:toll-like receptor 4 isoform X1 [Mya arenaria]|uniref:toll-like receptor 4 isoform X1 n=1 Tax=Mya arenaria TaxID=6604 RepID=UPI0022E08D8E|nr:toll-like receptor 4 isoform X1 [Mya arenaria]